MKPPTWIEAVRIANAAGADAGNRSMRAAGREVWSWDDLAVAASVCANVLRAMGWRVEG